MKNKILLILLTLFLNKNVSLFSMFSQAAKENIETITREETISQVERKIVTSNIQLKQANLRLNLNNLRPSDSSQNSDNVLDSQVIEVMKEWFTTQILNPNFNEITDKKAICLIVLKALRAELIYYLTNGNVNSTKIRDYLRSQKQNLTTAQIKDPRCQEKNETTQMLFFTLQATDPISSLYQQLLNSPLTFTLPSEKTVQFEKHEIEKQLNKINQNSTIQKELFAAAHANEPVISRILNLGMEGRRENRIVELPEEKGFFKKIIFYKNGRLITYGAPILAGVTHLLAQGALSSSPIGPAIVIAGEIGLVFMGNEVTRGTWKICKEIVSRIKKKCCS